MLWMLGLVVGPGRARFSMFEGCASGIRDLRMELVWRI